MKILRWLLATIVTLLGLAVSLVLLTAMGYLMAHYASNILAMSAWLGSAALIVFLIKEVHDRWFA